MTPNDASARKPARVEPPVPDTFPTRDLPASNPAPGELAGTLTGQPSTVSHVGSGSASGELAGQFGRYCIHRKLGQGGMGAVYLAHDTQLERDVALKVPHFRPEDGPQLLERFFREARAAATLTHPNICPVYDVGEQNGIRYLTMAYIAGQPLSALTCGDPLPQRPVAAVIHKLALALHEAHRKGVIHRDLKPANIMLTEQHEPVVMDFGLARRADREDERLTRPGTIVGTPAYMAPEQVEGNDAAIGPATDVYALGVILYELLTGQVPFRGSMAAVFGRILSEPPAPPSTVRSDLDPALEAICLKALAKSASERYASMAEMASALDGYLRGGVEAPALSTRFDAAAPSSPPAPDASQVARHYSDLASQFFAALAAQQSANAQQQFAGRRWVGVAAAVLAAGLVLGLGYTHIQRSASGPGTVVVHLHFRDLPLNDPVLTFVLDGTPISPGRLQAAIPLRTGEHELVVKRGDTIVQRRSFNIGRNDSEAPVQVPAPVAVAQQPDAVADRRPEEGDPATPAKDAEPASEKKVPEPTPQPKTADPPAAALSPAAKALTIALFDEAPGVRKQAAETLQTLGEKGAVPALIKRVGDNVWLSNQFGANDPEDGGKAAALSALKKLAPERVTEALMVGLQSADRHMRVWTAVEFGKHKDTAAVPALMGRVADGVWVSNQFGPNDPEDGGKAAALNSLRLLAPDKVTEALLNGLKSKTEQVRAWAAAELGKHKDKEVVTALIPLLNDADPLVRRAAAGSIQKLGDKQAVPALMRRVADDVWVSNRFGANDPIDGGKADALIALKQLAPERVSEALVEAMKSKDKDVKAWAALELGRLKKK